MEMLSAVALINQALEVGHLPQFGTLLVSASAGLADVDPTLLDRYDRSLACRHLSHLAGTYDDGGDDGGG